MKLSQLKQRKIRKVIDTGFDEKIEIYNITKENEKEISKILSKAINIDTKEVDIDGATMILKVMPLLSNIDLGYDIDNEEDKKIVDEIVQNPSDELLVVIHEIGTMIKQRMDIFMNNLDELKTLPKEKVEEIIKNKEKEIEEILEESNIDKPEEVEDKTQEELEIEIMEKKLALMKSKVKGNA